MTFRKPMCIGKMFGLLYLIGLNLTRNWRGFFCKICKEGGGKYVYANEGSTNIKISALQDHTKTNEHRKLSWAKHGGQKSFQKAIAVVMKPSSPFLGLLISWGRNVFLFINFQVCAIFLYLVMHQ